MKVYNVVGVIYYGFMGRLKEKDLIGSFSTPEQAKNVVSQVVRNYDKVEIIETELDKVERKRL